MQAVIYTRVSDDHTGRSRSTQDQEAECRKQCEREGWPVKTVLCDQDIGASRFSGKERPAYQELRQVLEPGDILVTWEASRAQRNMKDFVQLRDLSEELGALWSYSGRIYDMRRGDDRYFTGLDALNAEREVEHIRERVIRGKRAAAERGTPGSKPPWGYKTLRDEHTGRPINFIFDPLEVHQVRDAVLRVLEGESLTSILKRINSDGGGRYVRPQSAQALKRCLTNPQISGLRKYRGEVIGKAVWEPIISDEDRQRVIAALASPRRKADKGTAKYLLSYIAVCGVCGAPVMANLPSDRRRPVYVCSTPKRCVGRTMKLVDRVVEQFVLASAEKMNPSAFNVDDRRVAADLAQKKALEDQLRDFYEEAAEVGLSARAQAIYEARVLAQISDIDARLSVSDQSPLLRRMMGRNARAYWAMLSEEPDGLQAQRQIIRSMVKVTINKSTGNSRAFVPEDIEMEMLL